jgi:hypothetical protein
MRDGRRNRGSVGVSTDDLRDDFSEGIEVVVVDRDGGMLRPKEGMAVVTLHALGFGCTSGPDQRFVWFQGGWWIPFD